jgi:hypothetical protein
MSTVGQPAPKNKVTLTPQAKAALHNTASDHVRSRLSLIDEGEIICRWPSGAVNVCFTLDTVPAGVLEVTLNPADLLVLEAAA